MGFARSRAVHEQKNTHGAGWLRRGREACLSLGQEVKTHHRRRGVTATRATGEVDVQ